MNKVLRLAKTEIRQMFTNIVSVVIVMGLVILPSLFTWYNVLACWNVFDNADNLKVAVASADEGYESDLFPLKVNVGEQVISSLRANEDIKWVFTTEDDAIDGASSGKYYAAVVIPANFSKAMLTFYQSDAEPAQVIYYTNEKKNAIAPKITDKGADGISSTVNQVFAETLSDIALTIAKSLSNYMDQADASGTIAQLSNRMTSLADRIDQVSGALGLYAKLASNSQSVLDSSATLIETARSSAKEVGDIAQQGAASAESTAQALSASTAALSQAMQATIDAIVALEGSLEGSATRADAAQTAENLNAQADAVATQAASYRESLEALKQSGTADQATLDAMQQAIDQLDQLESSLRSSATDVDESGVTDLEGAKEQAKEAEASMEAAKTEYENNLKGTLDDLATSAASLADTLSAMSQKVDSASEGLSDSVSEASGSLGNAASQISTVSGRLGTLSSKLRTLSHDLDEALASGDMQTVKQLLGGDLDSMAAALSAPVAVERNAVFEAENFGSAMTPLYATLALFIGALLIMVVTKPTPTRKVLSLMGEEAEALKPRHLFTGHYAIVALISTLQSLMLATGNLFFLQVQVAHPLLFILCFWVTGQVFAFIIYTLVVAFANLGKAIAVLLLIVQVTGCGGSYPLQILPSFIQFISPYLPATHVVNAMRAAMFGVYNGDFWIEMGILLLFLIPALLLGYALRKPLASFMRWYVEKVEESNLMS